MMSVRTITVLACSAVLSTCAASDPRSEQNNFLGQAIAASWMDDECEGIVRLGGADQTKFVDQVAAIGRGQGLPENRTKFLLYYGEADSLTRAGDRVLQDRGVKYPDAKGLCALANDVAGTNDEIGRFLVKE